VAPITPGMVAMAHVALGDTDTAFAWLESAFEKRDQILTTLKVDLAWDPIRSDPRFRNLLQRVHLE